MWHAGLEFFPETWWRKESGRKREDSWISLRRRQDQRRVLFTLKDGGDPELDDIMKERAQGGQGEDRGDRWRRPDGELS